VPTPSVSRLTRVAVGVALLLSSELTWRDAAAEPGRVVSREVSFESSGYRLVGTLTRPDGRAVVAGVLLLPGSGPVDRNGVSKVAPSRPAVYRQWAQRLGEAGFAVMRYDKRFLTHPTLDVASFDQEMQIADAVAGLAAMRTAPDLPAGRVFILGHSEGGTLAPIVAGRVGTVSGLVIVNAVQFPVDELVVAQLQASPEVSGGTVAEVKRLFAAIEGGTFPSGGLLLGAGASYWKQWIRASRSSATTLARLATPGLLVQCLSDETLPGAALTRNLDVLRTAVARNRTLQLRELAGHDHAGTLPGEHESSPEFIRTLTEWLTAAARPAPADHPGGAAMPPRR